MNSRQGHDASVGFTNIPEVLKLKSMVTAVFTSEDRIGQCSDTLTDFAAA